MTDLDDLERLARAATPGPWAAKPDDWWWLEGVKHRIVRDTSDGEVAFTDSGEAEFIAAFNPVTVLALIERVQAAEAVIAEVQDAYDATLHPDQSPDRCGACRIERALARYMKGVGDE